MSKDINDYPIQVTIPMLWGEMDAQGHLNNSYYFRHFENTRAAYFHKAGILESVVAAGLAAVVAETSCKFKRSVSYPDTLTVGARISGLHDFGFYMEHILVTEKQGVAALGTVNIVMVDIKTWSKVKFSDDLLAACEKVEGRKICAEKS